MITRREYLKLYSSINQFYQYLLPPTYISSFPDPPSPFDHIHTLNIPDGRTDLIEKLSRQFRAVSKEPYMVVFDGGGSDRRRIDDLEYMENQPNGSINALPLRLSRKLCREMKLKSECDQQECRKGGLDFDSSTPMEDPRFLALAALVLEGVQHPSHRVTDTWADFQNEVTSHLYLGTLDETERMYMACTQAEEAWNRYRIRAYACTAGRVLFETSAGYVGLGPHSLQEDDLVCVLYGGKRIQNPAVEYFFD